MQEDLITPYGILKFLPRDEFSELNLNLDSFEESTGLTLTPFLLDEIFLGILEKKLSADEMVDDLNEESNDWECLWAIIHEGETIVGFLDFSASPESPGLVILRWTIAPDWIATPLSVEAVRSAVNWAFNRDDCRSIIIRSEDRPPGAMENVFRRLGFRREFELFKLTKALEGRLL